MKKTVPIYEEIPLEVGKTYQTRMATNDMFTITEIRYKETKNDKVIVSIMGIYKNAPHLGPCPINPGRLIPERFESGTREVCDCCGTPINEVSTKKHAWDSDDPAMPWNWRK